MNKQQQAQTKIKQAFSIAFGPIASNIPMLIMAWLMGSSVSYINVMFSFMLISNFISSISNVNDVFNKIKGLNEGTLILFKGIYLIACCGILLIACYKFGKMGILPNKDSDFIPLLSQRTVCYIHLIIKKFITQLKQMIQDIII